MTLKVYEWPRKTIPLLYCVKLCASFQIHWWIQTGVTVREPLIWVKIGSFWPVWPWNLMDDLQKQWGTSSIWHQALCIISKPLVNSNFSYSPETLNLGKIGYFLSRVTLKFWRMTFKNNRAPLLCYFKLCASFHSHQWIETGVTVWKSPIGQNRWVFFVLYDLEIWRMTLKNNRAPLLSNIKLCAPIHHHMWIQTGVTVRKWPSWVLTSVTLTFDSWKFHDDTMTGTLWKRCNKRTDGRMDRQTEVFLELPSHS